MNPEIWYRTNVERLRTYCSMLTSLIGVLIKDETSIDAIVTSRVKTLDSFLTKASKPKYENPVAQIFDFVGLRVIVPFEGDIEEIGRLIERRFDVNETESVNKSSALGPNEFGYRGDHKIFKICSTRASLPEWQGYQDISCEIQVRTILQHAWAQNELLCDNYKYRPGDN